ncbi:hypothetical protein LTR10_017933 [Elasticomyces elasticus]|uniref:Uncharacterized protein n=1 Tax=Exophiala sideris TaxID=1016849 RepID=A0ABR0IWH4_9EURO|nr:hypothetical protein LTR10_017933 [Elasticomyces elasticus]KAK5021775.1 hypothetical protein LTS07_010670 [Exophiala sideris]KAK5025865.1 hypothetical protein LTR13_010329 [Exophiala sideris]KAK5050229.1 hypothetical protein LTR69_010717 [Exophiala sideris]KAK5177012.1 hypothetical protein LTR44_010449 [Eurotiomycetes sp. CCFEE 6388]
MGDAGQSSPFDLTQAPYSPYRAVKVVIVGAGIGGIVAAALPPAKVPNLQYVVFERNDIVGGTWAQNTYPGVRCDVPSHAYQLTFAPNPRWSEYYAPGHEIREYYKQVVKDFGIAQHLRLRHEVLRTACNEKLSCWETTVRNLVTGEVFVETAEFIVSAQGRLNLPKKPYIPGLGTEFKGHVCHTAEWDDSYDFNGKKIAIVGNGASGQQLLVNILPQVNHIDHYARSKQWILPTFSSGFLEAKPELPGAYIFTEQEKERFASNPAAYLDFRRGLERNLHDAYRGSIARTAENEAARQRCVDAMLKRLGGDEQWLKRLLPDYAVGCKRPTPSPGYLEALRGPKVTYVDTGISYANRSGLIDANGTERQVDAIILATGFENVFLPLFPTIGKGGLDLAKHWSEDGPAGYPETYFGIMAPDMPNYFAVLQAQSYAAGGTVPLHCETSVTFIAKAIRKVQRESYKALYPSHEATTDFNEYVGAYYEDKVIGDSCNSWLKAGKGKTRPLCDETKPMCGACKRLALTCCYVTEFVSFNTGDSCHQAQHWTSPEHDGSNDSSISELSKFTAHPKVTFTIAQVDLSISTPDILYFSHFERLVRTSLPPSLRCFEFHRLDCAFLRYAVLCLAASHLSTLDTSLSSRCLTDDSRRSVTSPTPSPLHLHHAQRYHDVAQTFVLGDILNDPSLVLIGKVLFAYYHHASTDHLRFRQAVWETIQFVRKNHVELMESSSGEMALQLWYRLYNSHRPSRLPAVPIDGEVPSSSGPHLASPGADEYLHSMCIVGMSSDDLMHDILFRTMELRRRMVVYRCTSSVLGLPEASEQVGVQAYRLLSGMMKRPRTSLDEHEAKASFVQGDHILKLLEIQSQRLEVWKSRVDAKHMTPQKQACFSPPSFETHELANHRKRMNQLYNLLCRLLIESANTINRPAPDGIAFEDTTDISTSALLNEALRLIDTVEPTLSSLVDIYAFSLSEVLLQLCYTFPSTTFFDYILDVVWPRMEAYGRGYEHSHIPTHLAKRVIALIAEEWQDSRRIILVVPAVPEDTPKAVLLDVTSQINVVTYGYDTQQRRFFITKRQLP